MRHRMLSVLLLGTVFSFAAEGRGKRQATKAQTGVPFNLLSDFQILVKGGSPILMT
jgi:hypothetical protein